MAFVHNIFEFLSLYLYVREEEKSEKEMIIMKRYSEKLTFRLSVEDYNFLVNYCKTKNARPSEVLRFLLTRWVKEIRGGF